MCGGGGGVCGGVVRWAGAVALARDAHSCAKGAHEWGTRRLCAAYGLCEQLNGGEDVFGVGADAVVGVGFGEGDAAGDVAGGVAGGLDDEGGGEGETPGVVALVAVDEGDVDEDAAVVGAEGLGAGVGAAEGGGDAGAGVGE